MKLEEPQVNKENNRMSRRTFLKKAGVAAAVLATGPALNACSSEKIKIDFDNEVYNNILQDLEKQELTNSRHYKEFKKRYSNESFEKFRKKYDLDINEASKRWDRHLLHQKDEIIERAKREKEINAVAKRMGIDPDGPLDVEIEDFNIKRINGQDVPAEKNLNKDEIGKSKNNNKSALESVNVDTSVY